MSIFLETPRLKYYLKSNEKPKVIQYKIEMKDRGLYIGIKG